MLQSRVDMALAIVARHKRIMRGDRKQAQTYTNDTVQADTFCSAANMAITQLDKRPRDRESIEARFPSRNANRTKAGGKAEIARAQ